MYTPLVTFKSAWLREWEPENSHVAPWEDRILVHLNSYLATCPFYSLFLKSSESNTETDNAFPRLLDMHNSKTGRLLFSSLLIPKWWRCRWKNKEEALGRHWLQFHFSIFFFFRWLLYFITYLFSLLFLKWLVWKWIRRSVEKKKPNSRIKSDFLLFRRRFQTIWILK